MEIKSEANVPLEISFEADDRSQDPYGAGQFDVLLTDPTGRERRVPGFWAGGQTWKARYASPIQGTHRWRSDASDRGLHGLEGSVEIGAYTGDNLFFRHGPIRVVPGQRYLEHLDGTPFFWLADTWWTGLSHRLRWPDEFKELARDRQQKGFNAVQLVAGLYPDMHPFDPRGEGDAGFPWEPEYARIRPEYFDAMDRRLEALIEHDLMPCIVGAWGYYIGWMGREKAKAHWRNLIARYAAWPVTWIAAGEANLAWYLAEGFPREERSQVADWTDVMRFIRETDPFRRPLTIHPTGIKRFTARYTVDDPALLDFDILQTLHGQRDVLPSTIRATRESYAEPPFMPVIDSEGAYEMLADKLGTDWTRATFWVCVTNGAAGHTYGANGIWQLNRPDDPHGPSPHHPPGAGYGRITWHEAMNLAGSRQVAAGRKFLASLPWPELVPMADSVAWASDALSQWIWSSSEAVPPETKPARYFRRAFELPTGAKVKHATLSLLPADVAEVWLNGKLMEGAFAQSVERALVTQVQLVPGRNILAVRTDSSRNSFISNHAGFAAALAIELADTTSITVSGDDHWRASAVESTDWRNADFDDSKWTGVTLTLQDALLAPQCCGIGDRLRLIYVLDARDIIVRQFSAGAPYHVTHFDPVSGQTHKGEKIIAHESGDMRFTAPAGGQDWVLVLEKA